MGVEYEELTVKMKHKPTGKKVELSHKSSYEN